MQWSFAHNTTWMGLVEGLGLLKSKVFPLLSYAMLLFFKNPVLYSYYERPREEENLVKLVEFWLFHLTGKKQANFIGSGGNELT